jgi:hypothetical protein
MIQARLGLAYQCALAMKHAEYAHGHGDHDLHGYSAEFARMGEKRKRSGTKLGLYQHANSSTDRVGECKRVECVVRVSE